VCRARTAERTRGKKERNKTREQVGTTEKESRLPKIGRSEFFYGNVLCDGCRVIACVVLVHA
jgi:hypothetical protein